MKKFDTWGDQKKWEQALIDGNREGTIDDVDWLLKDRNAINDKFIYYMNLAREREPYEKN